MEGVLVAAEGRRDSERGPAVNLECREKTGEDREREFVYTAADFARIRGHILERAGIALGPIKRDMVYSRLSRLLRKQGLRSFGDYLDRLERGGDHEWDLFVNALTTNQTSFFREPHHFSILADYLRRSGRRSVSLWCCAASTGEEAYSLAMTLVEHFGGFDIPARILATDINTGVLETAREGIFPLERLANLAPHQVRRFFLKGCGSQAGYARARPELSRLISFRRLNLVDPAWPSGGPYDAIFCRNVMIYFDKPTQYRILRRFVPLLRRDGLFFAGHSESLSHAKDLFQPLGKTVYKAA